MAPKDTASDIASNVAKLCIKTGAPKPAAKKKKAPVADSWEDEDVSSSSESEHEQEGPATVSTSKDGSSSAGTSAPPPTPMSPTYGSQRPFSPTGLGAQSFDRKPAAAGPYYDGPADSFGPMGIPGGGDRDPRARPEKTDAVARRMIAGALGLRAPKLTEEQKAYDRAVREKEKRRKEEERELQKKREEEAAKAKQAVWDD